MKITFLHTYCPTWFFFRFAFFFMFCRKCTLLELISCVCKYIFSRWCIIFSYKGILIQSFFLVKIWCPVWIFFCTVFFYPFMHYFHWSRKGTVKILNTCYSCDSWIICEVGKYTLTWMLTFLLFIVLFLLLYKYALPFLLFYKRWKVFIHFPILFSGSVKWFWNKKKFT